MDKLLYTKQQAAELLSVSLRKLDSLIARNQILVKRIGKRVLISGMELEEFANGTGGRIGNEEHQGS